VGVGERRCRRVGTAMKKRHAWSLGICAALALFLFAVFLSNPLKNGIVSFMKLEEGVVGGGLVSEAAFRAAAAAGYRTVIDIRTREEGIEKEKQFVESLGLRYVNIPFHRGKAGSEEALRLDEVLSEKGAKPAILHCRSGNRVKMFWAMYQKMKRDGEPDRAPETASPERRSA